MSGLDGLQRTALERVIVKTRRVLEADLSARAEGRFGVDEGGVADESSLRLDPSSLADRCDIVGVVEHLCADGETTASAVRRLLREAAFTVLNRLVAIRVAEAIGVLQPSLADGRASSGFREVLEVAPALGRDDTGGYWTYLRLCGDELAPDAPQLFDPRNPLLALDLSPAALDEVVALLGDAALRNAWDADDTFGWTYQFFNTAEERKEMREVSAPRNSRELAVRNQFFTPRYVVDFLVQNSLGRRLVEADPTSALKDFLPLLVDVPDKPGEPLALDDVRVLDPACGSGHFLLGAYDLLEQAWQLQGVEPAEAAPRILPTLWGVDIDPRCAQVTAAALVLRARRHCRTGLLPRPNVVTARALPHDPIAWDRVLARLSEGRRKLVTDVRSALAEAPVLGSLLKVEERLSTAIRTAVPESSGSGTLFGATGVADDAFGRAEADVLAALREVADGNVSSAAERLLAAEADDAIAFVESMRQHYHVVLMNPPFGAPIEATKARLLSDYTPQPAKTYNVIAPFLERGISLLEPSGYVGALTSRTPYFTKSFVKWRAETIFRNRLVVFADLGLGVMQEALVEAAALVIGASRGASRQPASLFLRVLRDKDKEEGLLRALQSYATGDDRADRYFRTSTDVFARIEATPLAYWFPSGLLELLSSSRSLKSVVPAVRLGLGTRDDFRFVRAFWEVAHDEIGSNPEEVRQGRRWVAFAKGGEYSPLFGSTDLVVDWAGEGQHLRDVLGPGSDRPRSNIWMLTGTIEHFFKSGVTWSERTTSEFAPYVLRPGCIFSDKGPAIITEDREQQLLILGMLSTRFTRAVVGGLVAAGDETSSGTAARSYGVGLVGRLPWLGDNLPPDVVEEIVALVQRQVVAMASLLLHDETSRSFEAPPLLRIKGSTLRERLLRHAADQDELIADVLQCSYQVEEAVMSALQLSRAERVFLDDQVGPHPVSYSGDQELDTIARVWKEDTHTLIRRILLEQGGARSLATKSYIADRHTELVAHALSVNPAKVQAARASLQLLKSNALRNAGEMLMSYFVGVAFGRWDARLARADRSIAIDQVVFGPQPPFPPGLLLGSTGTPASIAPEQYVLALPPDHLLVDEVGHEWSLERRVREAANEVYGDAEALCAEVGFLTDRRTLGDYLRREFYASHLRRYSKSKRRAPLYWQLSVPSRNWGVWVYAPMLSRETLYAVAREAGRRQAAGAEQLRALQAEREPEARRRNTQEVDRRVEAERLLVEELQVFRDEAERIANLGWEPDLDDGIILCAAPLASLFPAWPDAAKERANLRKGAYPWATVARFADHL